ncbi:glutamate-5-semialdehyde dehydrogenase [Parvularcula sp. LCG005]|uniref:glutamate-5-semialdehyde dehydrogenase n=1 Tax=Parvularcula sp. LCG005 TaxID=3078805 RepID=UPI002941F58D|nr:glutamate-5-semialdehyde dehydrogenase [Parvularcula sp. LCG005]WOI53122.1 glutamate-5-semialdehyde dehydrogenase [Parvularcula sp. LCG005]
MTDEITTLVGQLGKDARAAGRILATLPADKRREGILALADAVDARKNDILEANQKDLDAGAHLSDAMKDRLALDEGRLDGAVEGLRMVANLDDPVGSVIAEWDRPNGLHIERVRMPMGVIAVIYEARPMVTVDAASLCMKSGNAVILRPGSDSLHTSRMLGEIMASAFESAGLPKAAAQVVPTPDRAAVGEILKGAGGNIDVVVPRGGRSLVERVQNEARVPVIGHLEGLCHVYLDKDADADMARDIIVNAKMRRTGVCGSAETVLIDRAVASRLVPLVTEALSAAGCEIRGDQDSQVFDDRIKAAEEADWTTEYLGPTIAMAVVDGVEGAIDHIAVYGSGHTESIVTDNQDTADRFQAAVDSSIVMHNASTQFADGGEFGMGAEIGIATGRLAPRGPVGAEQLCTYKYLVKGNGQTRP